MTEGKRPLKYDELPDKNPLELWHLGEIYESDEDGPFGLNVIKAHDRSMGSGVTVAIIDSGGDKKHPNLAGVISDQSCSFEPYLDKNAASTSDDVYNRYDAHGTALAGIVAGRKATGSSGTDAVQKELGAQEVTEAHKEFFGVAPEAEVLIIRLFTNFQPEQMIAALEHAEKNAQVILLARSLPEPRTKKRADEVVSPAVALDSRDSKGKTLKDVRNKVIEIAGRMPVICAAGNGGFNRLAFPAKLKETIAVGACNNRGWRSTYSQYGEGLDVVAPSNDVEMPTRDVNRRRVSHDTAKARRTGNGNGTEPENQEVTNDDRLGRWGIVTTDNRGDFGYSDSSSDYPDFVTRSGLRQFGGTSAASAQIAGVVALMLSAHKKKNGGKSHLAEKPDAVRCILRKSAAIHRIRLSPSKAKTCDKQPNIELGWGLVDADEAVKQAEEYV